MCTASLTLLGAMDVTVHNQYSDIELVSPVYFYNCEMYNEYPVERTDVGAMMKTSFRFGFDQDKPGGILMYEIQRKGNIKSDHQPGTDTTPAEAVEDTSKMMRLSMAWKIGRFGELSVHVLLVEHDNGLVLDEDRLALLYDKINEMPSGHNLSRWLICDDIVLVATYKAVQKGDLELKINISKGTKDKYTKSALWIDSERQVSYLMVKYSMLIYIVSLTLQSAANMTIDNQCVNIELASPVYFIKNATCYIHPPQQADSKSIMKFNFRTGMDEDTFGGVLLYYLQRKGNVKSDDQADTSISAQLLIICGSKYDGFYSNAYIIEHESTLTWDEDKLKRLYDLYNNLYDTDFNTGEWLLYNSIKLKTVRRILHEGDVEMNIIIYEDKYLSHTRKPLWVDPNR
jgi:hypothetical protein